MANYSTMHCCLTEDIITIKGGEIFSTLTLDEARRSQALLTAIDAADEDGNFVVICPDDFMNKWLRFIRNEAQDLSLGEAIETLKVSSNLNAPLMSAG